MTPDQILPIYEKEAATWAAQRSTDMCEEPVLRAALNGRAPGVRVLDIGCGSGEPIAAWFAARGDEVTGVDGSAAMIQELRRRVPAVTAVHADMRTLRLRQQFDVLLAWNSVFHLSPEDQCAMFPVFADHAAPGARVLLTTGHLAGERIGTVGQSRVYHASLDPDAYRALFAAHGFSVVWFRSEDAALRGHSVWLAEKPAA